MTVSKLRNLEMLRAEERIRTPHGALFGRIDRLQP